MAEHRTLVEQMRQWDSSRPRKWTPSTSRYWALLTVGEPKLVRDTQDLALLLKKGQEEASRELERRARDAVRFWKWTLGVQRARGRPRDLQRRGEWVKAALLKEEGWSWSAIAKTLCPNEYANHPPSSIHRLRMGVASLKPCLAKSMG
jgi:hypothetical protein